MKLQLRRLVVMLLAVCLVSGCISGCAGEDKQVQPQTQSHKQDKPQQKPQENVLPDDRTAAQRKADACKLVFGLNDDAYPPLLLEVLDRNPELQQFVLSYPFEHNKTHEIDMTQYESHTDVPLFVQWDKRWGYLDYADGLAGITGCGPTCLAMVAYYYTHDPDMNPANMFRFAQENKHSLKGGGSAWTLFNKGAVQLGMEVKVLPLVEATIRKEVEAGHPVVCNVGPGLFTTTGHYLVFVGYENGKFRINDPNSPIKSEQLWAFSDVRDQIKNLWAIYPGSLTKK